MHSSCKSFCLVNWSTHLIAGHFFAHYTGHEQSTFLSGERKSVFIAARYVGRGCKGSWIIAMCVWLHHWTPGWFHPHEFVQHNFTSLRNRMLHEMNQVFGSHWPLIENCEMKLWKCLVFLGIFQWCWHWVRIYRAAPGGRLRFKASHVSQISSIYTWSSAIYHLSFILCHICHIVTYVTHVTNDKW